MRWGWSLVIAVVSEVLCENMVELTPFPTKSTRELSCISIVWEAAANVVTEGRECRRAEMRV